jgi:DNA-binding transcriptional MocR family regulator
MGKLEAFAIEDWMNKYEVTPGCLDIASVCSASMSVDELIALNGDKNASHPLDFSTRLTYGEVPGSEKLRTNLAAMYDREGEAKLSAGDVLVTQGTAGANFLVYYSLLEPGDHVVSVYPTFQQLISLPKSFGADVSLWKLKKEEGFIPNMKDLESLVTEKTKVRHQAIGSVTRRGSDV